MAKAKTDTKVTDKKSKTDVKKAEPKKTAAKPVEKPKTVKPEKSAAVKVSHDQIAAKAYEIYLSRDNHPGDELSDWIKAEQLLTGKKPKTK